MAEQTVLETQQGLWIDAAWLRQAGLGYRFRVLIEAGEIRILNATEDLAMASANDTGWETWQTLGDDATPGRLSNVVEDHDQYLYGRH